MPIDISNEIEAINKLPTVAAILDIICNTTGMGFAAVAKVTPQQWVACAVKDKIGFGLQPGGELRIETTICDEVQKSHCLVVIDHVAEDELFSKHPTPAMYGFQSYISVPITKRDGTFFGTLCAIDPKPAQLNNPVTLEMFNRFAELISYHLETVDELRISETSLIEERKIAELREQFIAILGHDLRNPLSAITNVVQIMMRMPLDERMARLTALLQSSSFRMRELIDNILDFANGQMGGGIPLDRKDDEDLKQILNEVVEEIQLIWPKQVIHVNFDLLKPINCDGKRIAQLFSNLLSNAIHHGKTDTLVKVKGEVVDGKCTLSVINEAKKLSDNVMKHLFKPFSRGDVEPRKEGLGLGLYICSEIAKAHGGTLTVTSMDEETEFVFQFPV